jgi:hypothetical protein
MNWLFVLVDKGTSRQRWLLKIRNLQQLIAYHQAIRLAGTGLKDDISNRIKNVDLEHASHHTSDEDLDRQFIAITRQKNIYYDADGNWSTDEHVADNFLYRKFLEFPHFTEDDIAIKSFNDGTHSYARLGDLEVREGDVVKWDTFDEAYQACLRIIGQS